MDRCLYDPDRGFYASGSGSAGRRSGDFITSPEVGPLFADVLANALDSWWDTLGRPDPYRVYDAGTGPGTLARMLERAPGRSKQARRIEGFDRSDASGAPPNNLAGSVVIANELLDNLAFRILERSPDGWQEAWVTSEAGAPPTEKLVRVDPALTPDQAALLDQLPVGARVPLLDEEIGEPLIIVAPAAVSPPAGPSAATTGPLDLNGATAEQLESLPGIGPAIAAAIIAWRDENGGFAHPDDLLRVPGIGPAKMGVLRDHVTV